MTDVTPGLSGTRRAAQSALDVMLTDAAVDQRSVGRFVRRPGGVPPAGRGRAGQLVAGLLGLARRAIRRADRRAAVTREPEAPIDGPRAGNLCVRWEGAVVPDAHCVEVTGSHVGLAFNRKVYRAIAEALALPELEG
jgi:hypothetical protein